LVVVVVVVYKHTLLLALQPAAAGAAAAAQELKMELLPELVLHIPVVAVAVAADILEAQAAMVVKVWSLSAIPVLPHWAQAVLFLLIPVVVLLTWLTCSPHREHCLLLDQILVLLLYNIWSLLGAVVVLNVMVVVVELAVYLLEFV